MVVARYYALQLFVDNQSWIFASNYNFTFYERQTRDFTVIWFVYNRGEQFLHNSEASIMEIIRVEPRTEFS